jgi:hypothetical protein
MTQDNLPPYDDRSRPRYQPPTTGGFPGPGTTNSSGPVASRPTEWPAPTPAASLAPDPAFSAYAPPTPAVPPWPGMPSDTPAGQVTGNSYPYPGYNQAPYQPGAYNQAPYNPQAEAYRKATNRVRSRLDFQRHLRSYILVNAMLWGICLLTMNPFRPSFWPIWITVFWGIGLFAQYWQMSGREDEQRRRMIEEEMHRKHRY